MVKVKSQDLKHGDAIKCFIHGNFASGRIVVVNGNKYLANNDYANDAPLDKRSDRFGYRLMYYIGSQDSTNWVTKIEKVAISDLPYKTRDVLEDSTGGKFKILGRVGSLHFLSVEDDFDSADSHAVYTRVELDELGFSLYAEEEEKTQETQIAIEDMTLEEICAELGRTVRVKK